MAPDATESLVSARIAFLYPTAQSAVDVSLTRQTMLS
jgi:hypothetical protein